MFKDVPTIYVYEEKPDKTPDQSSMKLLLHPIIEHLKKLGQPVHKKKIYYYSEADKLDVWAGLDPVEEGFSIHFEELEVARDTKGRYHIDDGRCNLKINLKIKDQAPVLTTPSVEINRKASGLTMNNYRSMKDLHVKIPGQKLSTSITLDKSGGTKGSSLLRDRRVAQVSGLNFDSPAVSINEAKQNLNKRMTTYPDGSNAEKAESPLVGRRRRQNPSQFDDQAKKTMAEDHPEVRKREVKSKAKLSKAELDKQKEADRQKRTKERTIMDII